MNTQKQLSQLFKIAQQELNEKNFTLWLCFAYGTLSHGDTVFSLESLKYKLRELRNEQDDMMIDHIEGDVNTFDKTEGEI